MAATHKTKGAFEGAEGAICLNGSPGSPKSSFSSVCVGTVLLSPWSINVRLSGILLYRSFLVYQAR